MILYDVETPFNFILLLLQQDVYVLRYQRHLMRRFTVWIARHTSVRPDYNGNNQKFQAEKQSFENWIDVFPSLSVTSIYHAKEWVHLTLEIHGRHWIPFDKNTDRDVVIVPISHKLQIGTPKGASWILSQF